MVKVVLVDGTDDAYNAVFASESETPYQILRHSHINPATRKVFINGKRIVDSGINSPLSVYSRQTKIVYITVKI